MTFLLIDPPVNALSPPRAIEAWIRELDAMRLKYAGDAKALEQIDRARSQANNWLEMAREVP